MPPNRGDPMGGARQWWRHFVAKPGQSLISPLWRATFRDMTIQPPTPLSSSPDPNDRVAFDRTELGPILTLYGRMVAAGEWRDYGMSFLRDVAVFSVFRRAAENPLYRIEKRPRLRLRQGQYSVVSMDGQILKRGNDLRAVLRVLERRLIRAVK